MVVTIPTWPAWKLGPAWVAGPEGLQQGIKDHQIRSQRDPKFWSLI